MAHTEVPPSSSRTICELQCQLLTARAGVRSQLAGPACPDADLSAAAATPANPLGSYAPGSKCPSGQWPPSYDPEEGSWCSESSGASGPSGLRPLLQQLLRPLPGRGAAERLEALLGLQAGPDPAPALAWHPQQALLAAVEGGGGRVQVFDYSGRLPPLGRGAPLAPPPPMAAAHVLQHELQQQASAAAWRPNGGKCLAVGAARGVCLWHIGRPPPGSGSRSDGGAWMTWLAAPCGGAVTALAWHPQGTLLAGAAPGAAAGFWVWDVATGISTAVAAGLEGVSLLRWSPCGSYLLAAHPGGDLRIWQTRGWWSQRWAAAGGGGAGRVVEACWAPDSRSLLLAYQRSPQLVSLHFTGEPPSLQAQLLPLPLDELAATGAGGGGSTRGSTGASLIQAAAWDPRAQRLAIALGGAHPAAGCVALYDTRSQPILSARFIGFMRLGPLGGEAGGPSPASGERSAAAEASWEEIQPEEVAEAQGTLGSAGGTSAAPRRAGGGGTSVPHAAADERPQLAFLPSFAQGAVLAARYGSHVAAVPLYFAA